jgi:hypothetical protein
MIAINALRICLLLTAVAVVLTLLSVTGHALQWHFGTHRFTEFVRLFNISGEANVSTWFASFMLLVCAMLLLTIALAKQKMGGSYVRHWKVLSAAFLYISVDETAQIHELLIEPLHVLFATSGILLFAWVIPGTIVVLVMALAYLRFLAHLPARTRHLFIVAAALYVGGALGMEMLGGYVADELPNQTIVRGAVATIEDLFEMMGVIVFMYALMSYNLLTFNLSPTEDRLSRGR